MALLRKLAPIGRSISQRCSLCTSVQPTHCCVLARFTICSSIFHSQPNLWPMPNDQQTPARIEDHHRPVRSKKTSHKNTGTLAMLPLQFKGDGRCGATQRLLRNCGFVPAEKSQGGPTTRQPLDGVYQKRSSVRCPLGQLQGVGSSRPSTRWAPQALEGQQHPLEDR